MSRSNFEWEPRKRMSPKSLDWRLSVSKTTAKVYFPPSAVYAEKFNPETHKVLIGTNAELKLMAFDLIPIDEPAYGRMVVRIVERRGQICFSVKSALTEMGLKVVYGKYNFKDPSVDEGLFVIDLIDVTLD